jgi:phosphoglycerol transferase
MDTHDPTGTAEEFKKKLRRTDELVKDFVEWYKEIDPNAVVVIVGDHLARGTENSIKKNISVSGIEKRNIYNVILNSFKSIENGNRIINWYDLFPTIIESIGADIEGSKLGFGTSLYSGEATLTEKIGITEFEVKSTIGGSRKYRSFFRDRQL